MQVAIVAGRQAMLAFEGGGEMVLVLEAALLGQQLHRVGPAGQQERRPLQPQPLQQRHGRQREVLLAEPVELALGEMQGAGHARYVPRLGQRLFEQQFEAQRQPLATPLPLPLLQQTAQVKAELLNQQGAEQRVLMALLLRIEVLDRAQYGGLLGGTTEPGVAGEGIPGGILVQQQPHQLPLTPLIHLLVQRLTQLIAEWLPGRDQRPLADLQPLAAIAHLHLPLTAQGQQKTVHISKAARDAVAGLETGIARQPHLLLCEGRQQAVTADLLAAVGGDIDNLGVGSFRHHQDGLSHVEGTGPSIASRASSHRRPAMHIHHVAIWAQDLEALKAFYCTLFGGQANERYHNPSKQFSSYFVRFEGGASLELMHTPILFPADLHLPHPLQGLAHLAFSLGSVEEVDKMTARLKLLKGAEVKHLDGPRWTGDGYYESTFLDPEGNRLELTI